MTRRVFLAGFSGGLAMFAWLLSMASPAVLSSYSRRVLFVASLGMVIALNDDVLQMAFGPLAEDYLTFLAISNLVAWILTGLMIGFVWIGKPLARGPLKRSQGRPGRVSPSPSNLPSSESSSGLVSCCRSCLCLGHSS